MVRDVVRDCLEKEPTDRTESDIRKSLTLPIVNFFEWVRKLFNWNDIIIFCCRGFVGFHATSASKYIFEIFSLHQNNTPKKGVACTHIISLYLFTKTCLPFCSWILKTIVDPPLSRIPHYLESPAISNPLFSRIPRYLYSLRYLESPVSRTPPPPTPAISNP